MNKTTRSVYMILVLTLLAFPLSACQPQGSAQTSGQLKGTLTVSGAFALYPLMQRWGDEFKKANPQVSFDISAGGAGKGMSDVLSGAVDIAMVSRQVTSDETAKSAFALAVAKDAVLPMINARNPVLPDLLSRGVTPDQFIRIFITGKIKTWGQLVGKPEITDEIHVYTRSDSAGAADAWAGFLGNKKQDNLVGIGVSGDPGLLDAVVKDPLGIGYNNLSYAFDPSTGKAVNGAVVLPIDQNANSQAEADEILDTKAHAKQVIAAGKYPSPPARLEYLVTRGKPTGLALAFLQWALADGQKFVDEAGYVQLTPDLLNASVKQLR